MDFGKGSTVSLPLCTTRFQCSHLLALASRAVESTQILFAASTTLNKSEDPPQRFRANGPLYVGPPTQEIDEAWDDLLNDQYFYITGAQAGEAWEDGY